MQYDDSKDYRGLKNADVVLVGLSRTSKTPLCMYLANKGIKAINIPLVPEVEVPKELYEIDKHKIFGLTINPLQLIEIRKRRLDKFHRIPSNIEYAGDARILEEFDFADKIIRRLGCKTIDVTQRAIEDTALIIIKALGCDKDYRGLKNADVVLVGLSRTSKTPLCMYLANKGIKAINIPLVPEVEVPKELYEIDKHKIFGLTINPLQLIEIRKRRLDKFHRIPSNIEYAGDARILEEFDFADKIIRRLGCKTIDVTQRAIEDTALIIIKALGCDK